MYWISARGRPLSGRRRPAAGRRAGWRRCGRADGRRRSGSARSSSQNTVSDGLWPGRCSTCSVRSRSSSVSPSRSGRVTRPLEPNALNACADRREHGREVAGTPWRRMIARRELVIRRGAGTEVAQVATSRSNAATSAPERRVEDLEQPEVVHVLVGDDDQLQVLDRVAQRARAPARARRATCPSWARCRRASAARPRSGSS